MTGLPRGADAAPLLAVDGLSVDVKSRQGLVSLTHDVSFSLERRQTVGLVGESGCGKTMTSLAIMGLLPRVARVESGSVRLEGRELVGMPRDELDTIRGRRMAMIFQDATRSLNPAFTVGNQIAEVARKHLDLSRKAALAHAIEMMDRVGIKRPQQRVHEYPHMFSGGMSQRVMIAMALACGPSLLIADEPTTALDVTVQAQVLRLLRQLQDELGLGILFITHDLGVIAEICDRVLVMYAGEIVERAPIDPLFMSPKHPYTAGLIDAIPQSHHRLESFGFIPGTVPSPRMWPSGCRFHPRCPHAQTGRCDVETPILHSTGVGHDSRCIRSHELDLAGLKRDHVA